MTEEIFSGVTGSNGVQDVMDRPLSDTSSDSGLDAQQILSPDLFDCITSGDDDEPRDDDGDGTRSSGDELADLPFPLCWLF